MRQSVWIGMAMAVVAAGVTASADGISQRSTPQSVADELLAVDVRFAAAAARTSVLPALMPMLAADVIMPAPPGTLVKGRDAAVAALEANPDNASGRVTWAPIRVGLSADGQGFTFGFMTLTTGDGRVVPLKYMTYWVKGADGWRAAAYKRAPARRHARHGRLARPGQPPLDDRLAALDDGARRQQPAAGDQRQRRAD